MKSFCASSLLSDLLVNYSSYTGERHNHLKLLTETDTRLAVKIAVGILDQLESNPQYPCLPLNAGKRWSDDEDRDLAYAFDLGLSVFALSASHQRTITAIRDRLTLLGKGSGLTTPYHLTQGNHNIAPHQPILDWLWREFI